MLLLLLPLPIVVVLLSPIHLAFASAEAFKLEEKATLQSINASVVALALQYPGKVITLFSVNPSCAEQSPPTGQVTQML
jgi:hypothetical protein